MFVRQDSTKRPKLQDWSFDQGKAFVDQWAAEGKPNLSNAMLRRVRVMKVLAFAVAGPLCVLNGEYGVEEHVLSPVQRTVFSWFAAYTALDTADYRQAKLVDDKFFGGKGKNKLVSVPPAQD